MRLHHPYLNGGGDGISKQTFRQMLARQACELNGDSHVCVKAKMYMCLYKSDQKG